jgi:EpsI family protein
VRALLLGLLLMLTALGAAQLRPDQSAGSVAPPDLERMIPRSFAGWRVEPQVDPVNRNPVVTAKVESVYTSTLERIYRDAGGHRIMLSIAYGSNQLGDGLQAHRPEYCYRAQGFEVGSGHESMILAGHAAIPVRRLLARSGRRNEPISYWLTIGNRAALPGLTRKLEQLRHGLAGAVPDGFLVRVSSLADTGDIAYRLHDRFVAELLAAMSVPNRIRLAGNGSSGTPMTQSFSLLPQPRMPNQLQ